MKKKTNVLIIGAGPFGLSLAAYLGHLGIDHLVVGKPMEFWKNNMPQGMFLRSASDWSLDPTEKCSILNYLNTLGKTPAQVEPLSLEFYLQYAQWFQEQSGIQTLPFYVTRLDQVDGRFHAALENGDVIEAQNVVVAIGMGFFKNQPSELSGILPEGRFQHTCDAVQLSAFSGKRVLILGGRQSAFEWTALLNDAGARKSIFPIGMTRQRLPKQIGVGSAFGGWYGGKPCLVSWICRRKKRMPLSNACGGRGV
jgi:FAD-dependent urate hydroxylase